MSKLANVFTGMSISYPNLSHDKVYPKYKCSDRQLGKEKFICVQLGTKAKLNNKHCKFDINIFIHISSYKL